MIYDKSRIVAWCNVLTDKDMYGVAFRFANSSKWVHVNADGNEDRVSLFKSKSEAEKYMSKAVENLIKRGFWKGENI